MRHFDSRFGRALMEQRIVEVESKRALGRSPGRIDLIKQNLGAWLIKRGENLISSGERLVKPQPRPV